MRLRRDINLGTLLNLPRVSIGWRASLDEQLAMLRERGYEGAQAWDGFARIHRAGLLPLGMARATQPQLIDEIARAHRGEGLALTNFHIGTGFETDSEMDALAGALLDAQARHGHTLLVETHRATATQDIWRTLQWIERFPELRFTADLSHWYTGHELTYGGEFEERSSRLAPVMDRVRAFHGRIGNSGGMQTPLNRPGHYVDHYRRLWTAACEGFLRHAAHKDTLSFAPELLPMSVGDPPLWLNYQQATHPVADDPWHGEPCDRFADAEWLWQFAVECFSAARSRVAPEVQDA